MIFLLLKTFCRNVCSYIAFITLCLRNDSKKVAYCAYIFLQGVTMDNWHRPQSVLWNSQFSASTLLQPWQIYAHA